MRALLVNCNGIRQRRRRLRLAALMFTLRVGVCTITETHLREAEVDQLRFRNYAVITRTCRETVGRIGGGVLILVHTLFKSSKVTLPRTVAGPIESCRVLLFPIRFPEAAVVITGVYVPPKQTKHLTLDGLSQLSTPIRDKETQLSVSHIITGDFNATTWIPLFEEWGLESGIWQLNDPVLPTATTGSTLDHVLFIPGYYIPSTFLPPDFQEEAQGAHVENTAYPASVLPTESISDHYPVVLPIPCDIEHATKKTIRLQLKTLTDEDWSERNNILSETLQKKNSKEHE